MPPRAARVAVLPHLHLVCAFAGPSSSFPPLFVPLKRSRSGIEKLICSELVLFVLTGAIQYSQLFLQLRETEINPRSAEYIYQHLEHPQRSNLSDSVRVS
jgi:hypothetical protein